jgi:drug/metabolite transporter superfamily protein YnfA
MHSIISALFRGAKRLFGPVWGIRIVNLVLFIYFSMATITDEGSKRVFAIAGAIFILIETALVEWERRHPRPKKRRRTVFSPSEVDQP